MTEGVGRRRRRLIAVAGVAVLLTLSGCSLFDGGTVGTGTPTPEPTNASLDTVRSDALAAMDAVDSYRVNGTVERQIGAPRRQGGADPQNLVDPRTVVTRTTVEVNRTARELYAEDIQRAEGQTVSVETWVVNGTLYANSPAFRGDPDRFRDDYGSEWIVRRPADFEARFAALDPISRQRALLSAANLTLEGVDPETGTYVLSGTVPGDTYERFLGNFSTRFSNASEFEVTSVAVTYYLDRETGRPVRFEGEVGLTVPTDRGVVPVFQTVTLTYDGYGRTVNVTAPADAPDPPEDGRLVGSAGTDDRSSAGAPSVRVAAGR